MMATFLELALGYSGLAGCCVMAGVFINARWGWPAKHNCPHVGTCAIRTHFDKCDKVHYAVRK